MLLQTHSDPHKRTETAINGFITTKDLIFSCLGFLKHFFVWPAGAGRREEAELQHPPDGDQLEMPPWRHRHKRNIGCAGRLVNHSPWGNPERVNRLLSHRLWLSLPVALVFAIQYSDLTQIGIFFLCYSQVYSKSNLLNDCVWQSQGKLFKSIYLNAWTDTIILSSLRKENIP